MGKINFLALSDIHDNVRAVKKLRAREKNTFDAVIIAGDIGDNKDDEILKILSSFDCPILYIYGNWDNTQSYDKKFSQNCIHLHQNIVNINDYTFSGFSGCQTSWGENPIAKTLISEVNEKHEKHILNVKKLKLASSEKASPLREARYLLNQRYMELLNKKGNHAQTLKLELEESRGIYLKDIKVIYHDLEKALNSKQHEKYQDDLLKAYKYAEDINRKELIQMLNKNECDFTKTILVTHERLSKTHQDIPDLFAHIFGHRHGFKHTVYKNTHFINVSSLDTECTSTYCKIDIQESEMNISCITL